MRPTDSFKARKASGGTSGGTEQPRNDKAKFLGLCVEKMAEAMERLPVCSMTTHHCTELANLNSLPIHYQKSQISEMKKADHC
jgi:hypothetical protein